MLSDWVRFGIAAAVVLEAEDGANSKDGRMESWKESLSLMALSLPTANPRGHPNAKLPHARESKYCHCRSL